VIIDSIWFTLSGVDDAGLPKGAALDTIKFTIEHNKNHIAPYKEFTVCILETEGMHEWRTIMAKGYECYRSYKGSMTIRMVFVIRCGPTGSFSASGATIQLVRDNCDMVTPVRGVMWTVDQLRSDA
jgi:hypothetical protein